MCSVTSWLTSLIKGTAMYMWQDKNYDKAKKETNKKIQAAGQAAKDQVEQNKLANSVQSTEELKNPLLNEELKQQKVPLNTGSTGASTASPTSVGLNLGGY